MSLYGNTGSLSSEDNCPGGGLGQGTRPKNYAHLTYGKVQEFLLPSQKTGSTTAENDRCKCTLADIQHPGDRLLVSAPLPTPTLTKAAWPSGGGCCIEGQEFSDHDPVSWLCASMLGPSHIREPSGLPSYCEVSLLWELQFDPFAYAGFCSLGPLAWFFISQGFTGLNLTPKLYSHRCMVLYSDLAVAI